VNGFDGGSRDDVGADDDGDAKLFGRFRSFGGEKTTCQTHLKIDNN
jgi:hypothetical protein